MQKLGENPAFVFWSRVGALLGAFTMPLASLVIMMLFQRLDSIERQLEQTRIERVALQQQIAKMEGRFDGLVASLIRIEHQVDKARGGGPL